MGEGGQVETALSGETAVMAAPLQHVHAHSRCVGQLEEEELLPRNVTDGGGVVPTGEDVETVQAQPQERVICLGDELPGVFVGGHVTTPGQCLVGHPYPVRFGCLG